jgi:hypothetical protein
MAMDPATAIYDGQGNLVCPACVERKQLAEGRVRAASYSVGGVVVAIGVLVGGMLAVLGARAVSIRGGVDAVPVTVVSIVTVVVGLGWLRIVEREPSGRTRGEVLRATSRGPRVGESYGLCFAAVCGGMLLGGGALVFAAPFAYKETTPGGAGDPCGSKRCQDDLVCLQDTLTCMTPYDARTQCRDSLACRKLGGNCHLSVHKRTAKCSPWDE